MANGTTKKALTAIAVALLLCLGAIAAGYFLVGDRVVFIVENQCGTPLTEVVVMIGGTAYAAETLDAGDRARVVVRALRDCSPHLKYTLGGTVHDTDLEFYLTTGMRGTLRITVKPDELVVVEDVFGHGARTLPASPASGRAG